MKKILFVDTGCEFGGGTKSFLYLLQGLLAQKKYEIYVFFENDYETDGKQISQIINEMGAKFVKFKPKKQICKFKKELLRAVSKQLLAKQIYENDYKFALEILSFIKPDVVHLNNHFSTNLAYNAAANALNIAVIQHLRKNSAVEKFKLEILNRLKFTPICVSNATYDFYSAQVKMPKNVVYNPVITAQNSGANATSELNLSGFDESAINIIMPANFLSLKGHELVFDALLGLKRADVRVYFAGGGELVREMRAKFDELLRTGRAVYLGFVRRMDEIYAKFDYVLGFSSDEGLPRVAIEALSRGLGVIYSDIAVIREIYNISSKKQDFIIAQRNSVALLGCLENLKKPNDKTPDNAVIEAFSLENYLFGIGKIYDEIL